jgi:lysine 2,3-aminomutase
MDPLSRRLTGSPAVSSRETIDSLGEEGKTAEIREAARRFPMRWNSYYLGLVDVDDPNDPIRRIAFPDPQELESCSGDLADPVGERLRTPVPFVVRKHRDRAVFLVTSRCHIYCRFCFRRSFPDGDHLDPSDGTLDRAIEYLTSDRELEEVILSGGDPLTLPDATLQSLIGRLSVTGNGRGLQRLRVHSRALVQDPSRITPQLAGILASGLPMRFVTHFNHPNERTEQTRQAVAVLREAGMPVSNQSVLLRGVNDDPSVLENLFCGLLEDGVKPYYLHHPDRVPGAASFYLEPERGLAIFNDLAIRLDGGPALPRYVIDPPDGSGKIDVRRWLESSPRRHTEKA